MLEHDCLPGRRKNDVMDKGLNFAIPEMFFSRQILE